MAEEEVRELKEKLESYQQQFQNYKVQCKQLQAFLEEEAVKKQNEIRQLKEQAIKREKQNGLLQRQLATVQSENKQLKLRIKQLEAQQKPMMVSEPGRSNVEKIQQKAIQNLNSQLEQAYKKVKSMQLKIKQSAQQKQEMIKKQNIIKDIYESQIKQLHEGIDKKAKQIQQLTKQLEKQRQSQVGKISHATKMPTNTSIIIQPAVPAQNRASREKNSKNKLNRTLEITIQKTTSKNSFMPMLASQNPLGLPTYSAKEQKYLQLKQMYKSKQNQLIVVRDRNNALLTQIAENQQKIHELQQLVQAMKNQKTKIKSINTISNQFIQNKTQQYQNLKQVDNRQYPQYPQYAPLFSYKGLGSKHSQSAESHEKYHKQHEMEGQQVTYEQKHKQNRSIKALENAAQHNQKNEINTLIYALFVTKTYYKSPFLQFEHKNIIRLYKQGKNGKIDQTLGSLQYKVNGITYNIQQLATRTVENIMKKGSSFLHRVLVIGGARTFKRALMGKIISKLKNCMLAASGQSSNRSSQAQQFDEITLKYMQFQDDFVKNKELQSSNRVQIFKILQILQKQICIQQAPQTPKRNEKYPQAARPKTDKHVRFLKFQSSHLRIQLITSNFLNSDIKESQGLQSALFKIAYSKIPELNYTKNAQQERNFTQILLTINPIVDLYEDCRQTLKLANCKKRQPERLNVFDWKDSPGKQVYYLSSGQRQKINQDMQKQIQNYTIFKLIQKVQFYKTKLMQLIVQLKIILNSTTQVSYMKKPPTVLNLQKILRFVQSLVNQGQSQMTSPSRKKQSQVKDKQFQSN